MSLTPDLVCERIGQHLPFLEGVLHPDTPLDRLGLDSLDLVELLLVIDELFGVQFAVEDFKNAQTVGELAESIIARAELEVHQT
jgi:acyl carrier protein